MRAASERTSASELAQVIPLHAVTAESAWSSATSRPAAASLGIAA